MTQNEATDGGLEHQLRGLLQGFIAMGCFALIAYTYYQMLFGDFSLAAFAQRALLTSITAGVVLLLHRLLFYRLPPAYSLLLWVLVLVQIAGVSLASLGVFNRGLENQLPEIEVQVQTQLPDTSLSDQGTADDIASTQRPEEVILSYPNGAQQTVSYSQTLAQVVRCLWLGGTALLCLWFWGTYLIFVWRLPKGAQCIPPAMLEAFARAKQTAQTAQEIHLVFTAKDGPLLLGILRPRIVLPVRYCSLQEYEQRQGEPQTQDLYFILLHELTHAKNGDNLWSALAIAALATQWYNPLVWLCFASLKRDIERRCDYTVAAMTRNKKAYASVLLNTIRQRG